MIITKYNNFAAIAQYAFMKSNIDFGQLLLILKRLCHLYFYVKNYVQK